jgi:hypothetical protein
MTSMSTLGSNNVSAFALVLLKNAREIREAVHLVIAEFGVAKDSAR